MRKSLKLAVPLVVFAGLVLADDPAPADDADAATTAGSDVYVDFTTPACVEGTSIVALSLSSVTRESSFLILSPGFTSSSMTGTSLKSPMSGTLTSIALMGSAR